MAITVPDEILLSSATFAERINEGGKIVAPGATAKLRAAVHTSFAWASRPSLFTVQGKWSDAPPTSAAIATAVDGADPRETLATGIGRLTKYGRRVQGWIWSGNLEWALDIYSYAPPSVTLITTITPAALSTPVHRDDFTADLSASLTPSGTERDLLFILKARRFDAVWANGSLVSCFVQEAPYQAADLP